MKLTSDTMRTYRRLLSYLRPYKKRFVIGVAVSFIASILNAVSVSSFMPIVDTIAQDPNKPYQIPYPKNEEIAWKKWKAGKHLSLKESVKARWFDVKRDINLELAKIPSSQLLQYAFLVIPFYLLRLLAGLGTVYFITSSGLLAVRDMRNRLFEKMLRLPMNYFYKEKTGDLMSRLINDAGIVSDSISNELRITINNIFLVAIHLSLLIFISWRFFILCIVIAPVVIYPATILSKKIRKVSMGEQQQTANLNGHLQEVIAGIRVTRAFAAEKYETGRYSAVSHNLYEKTFKGKFYHALGPSLVELTTTFVFVGMLIYGGQLVQNHPNFTIGTFIAFIFIFLFILSPIKQLTRMLNLIARASASGERIFQILDYPENFYIARSPKKFPDNIEKLEVSSVDFSYPDTDRQVLHDINFTVERGQNIALVGQSGGGKSTLVDLIPRFFDPQGGGKILLNGIDIREYDISLLRRNIGFVSQEVFLYNTSVRNNICYAHPEISEEQLVTACKEANAYDFIKQLPDGFDTMIGDKGVMLSGGQRQRLSIARALLKNPSILILDEATSALDTESEKLVQDALDRLIQERTTITIAHRLSTIFKADEILVIDEGRITERGTHEELLVHDGIYRKLYDMQFS